MKAEVSRAELGLRFFFFLFFSVITLECVFELVDFRSTQLYWEEHLVHLTRAHLLGMPAVFNLEN